MDVVMGSPATLEHLAQEARVYPDALLRQGEEALCLFSAAFLGVNDAIHFALAGMTATCVDTDAARLAEMEALYPDDWEFECADAFEFAANETRQWDVVSVDPFTNYFDHVARLTPLWCGLARRLVLVAAGPKTLDAVKPPQGWTIIDKFHRSSFRGGVWWIVMEKA